MPRRPPKMDGTFEGKGPLIYSSVVSIYLLYKCSPMNRQIHFQIIVNNEHFLIILHIFFLPFLKKKINKFIIHTTSSQTIKSSLD